MGEDFFWVVILVVGDYILFKFDKSVNVERLVLKYIWFYNLDCLFYNVI